MTTGARKGDNSRPAVASGQGVFGHRQDEPRPVADVLHAVTLIIEATRMGELRPAVILTLLGVGRWAAPSLVPGEVDGRRPPLRDDEGVVDDDVLRGAEVLRPVDMSLPLLEGLPRRERLLRPAAPVLDGQRAALDDVEGVAGVIMPTERLPRLDGERAHRHRGRA